MLLHLIIQAVLHATMATIRVYAEEAKLENDCKMLSIIHAGHPYTNCLFGSPERLQTRASGRAGLRPDSNHASLECAKEVVLGLT